MRRGVGSWKKRWKVSLGREEEVREKWSHAGRSDNNRRKGLAGLGGLLAAKLRGLGVGGVLW